jgi:Tfp pilus assembly protein PilF
MTLQQTLGYTLVLRADLWAYRHVYDRAIADYRAAMSMYPQSPVAFNNFAWLVVSRDVPNRRMLESDALRAAQHAVAIDRTANYLDTLACSYALAGDFAQAILVAKEATHMVPGNTDFANRLARFKEKHDCSETN